MQVQPSSYLQVVQRAGVVPEQEGVPAFKRPQPSPGSIDEVGQGRGRRAAWCARCASLIPLFCCGIIPGTWVSIVALRMTCSSVAVLKERGRGRWAWVVVAGHDSFVDTSGHAGLACLVSMHA